MGGRADAGLTIRFERCSACDIKPEKKKLAPFVSH